jgi:hypothetical protein
MTLFIQKGENGTRYKVKVDDTIDLWCDMNTENGDMIIR